MPMRRRSCTASTYIPVRQIPYLRFTAPNGPRSICCRPRAHGYNICRMPIRWVLAEVGMGASSLGRERGIDCLCWRRTPACTLADDFVYCLRVCPRQHRVLHTLLLRSWAAARRRSPLFVPPWRCHRSVPSWWKSASTAPPQPLHSSSRCYGICSAMSAI